MPEYFRYLERQKQVSGQSMYDRSGQLERAGGRRKHCRFPVVFAVCFQRRRNDRLDSHFCASATARSKARCVPRHELASPTLATKVIVPGVRTLA